MPMRGKEFKAALKRVGLSVYASAPFLGISLSQAQRIAAGKYEAAESAAKLLELMAHLGMTAADWDDRNRH